MTWFDSVGWGTDRAWVAHFIFPGEGDIARLAAWGTGVAHCPTSCLLMGVGIAPVDELRRAGVPVGIGVDGSANSDMASMWAESRMALLANRFRAGPASLSARDVLEMATLGGASCLGRTGALGTLAPGAAGDLVVWPIEGVPFAGAVSDPIEAWLRCGPGLPRHTLVAGRALVEDGELRLPGIEEHLAAHRAVAVRLQGL